MKADDLTDEERSAQEDAAWDEYERRRICLCDGCDTGGRHCHGLLGGRAPATQTAAA